MIRLRLLTAVLALVSSACTPAASPASLADGVSQRLAHGVFEVVVAAPGDGAVTYRSPLPLDLLPIGIRNAPVWPIGTAFAISPTEFVTAAHVLLAARERPIFLRVAGTTLAITKVVKMSEYRDLAVFEVGGPLPGVEPLGLRTDVAAGEPVFTVGDAVGAGIVVRGGVVTSFTPEDIEGKWQNVRFTAPASPGNSGGPLVDGGGRAVAVVVRKSPAENLNVGVPVSELRQLSETTADIGDPRWDLREDHHDHRTRLEVHPPLPSTLRDLVRASRSAIEDAMGRWHGEFDAKYGAETFPRHPGLRTLLVEHVVPPGLGMFEVDGNGVWTLRHSDKYKQVRLGTGEAATFFEGPDTAVGELLLDRPKGMSLAAFFDSPRDLADAVARNYSWAIPFAGRRIEIDSLGAPSSNERWVDGYGRPWFFISWRIERTDEEVLFACLTNPSGWACRYARFPASIEPNMLAGARRMARRTTLSYSGYVRDWAEFLALPDRYKPAVLKDATVTLDDGLSVRLGPLVVDHLRAAALSPDSTLYAQVGLNPDAVHEPRIYEARIRPKLSLTHELGVREVHAPIPATPPNEVELWKKLRSGAAPFDNVSSTETATQRIMKRGSRPPGDDGSTLMRLEFCRSPIDDPPTELTAACTAFQEALHRQKP